MTFFLSRVMHPDDFVHLTDESARVDHALNMFAGIAWLQHPARRWEYSMALASLGPRNAIAGKRVLDVGCCSSILPGLLVWSGVHVTANDADDHDDVLQRTAAIAFRGEWGGVPGGSFYFVHGDFKDINIVGGFDAVLCISVIEHDPEPHGLFRKLLNAVAPGGSLFLTTDFHPSGVAMIPNPGHYRTYNRDRMSELIVLGESRGFEVPAGPDYHYHGDFVNNYNFASLHLRRKL